MSDAPTPRTSLAARVSVTAICRVCGHNQPLDLADLIARGHADTPLLALPLRCRCGERGFEVIVSGYRPLEPRGE